MIVDMRLHSISYLRRCSGVDIGGSSKLSSEETNWQVSPLSLFFHTELDCSPTYELLA